LSFIPQWKSIAFYFISKLISISTIIYSLSFIPVMRENDPESKLLFPIDEDFIFTISSNFHSHR